MVTFRNGWMPVAGLLLVLLATHALAANTPCSGGKGGIAHCDGELFVCNDGSISGSKKSCAAVFGEKPKAKPQSFLQSNDECTCGSGSFCTGPRGGVYCLTPSGNRSYKRK
ncbi:hypothetical protein [Pseudomonas zeae]|uniref:YdcA family protein n=1 Tax=Pseudomonas zeae TaxID=2745510 RepID=UPI0039E12673